MSSGQCCPCLCTCRRRARALRRGAAGERSSWKGGRRRRRRRRRRCRRRRSRRSWASLQPSCCQHAALLLCLCACRQ
jgi:hypothetical protein